MEGMSDIPLSMLKGLQASMAVMQETERRDAKKNSNGMASMGNRTPRPSAPRLESFPEPAEIQLLTEIPTGARQQESVQMNTRPMNSNSIHNSKLSPEIKKLMMDYQIEDPATYVNPILGISENTRVDLMGITEDAIPTKAPLPEFKSPRVFTEENDGHYVAQSTDTNTMRRIIREEIENVMSETYAKKIRKEAIENTIRTLKSKGLLK
tara:strand:+ start:5832 stop:6458 length:627 start_codon:yes stop_codon:yes gene_type:complete